MRKFTVFIPLFLVLVAGTLSAQQMKLDRAVARTAAALEGVLPQKAKVAVLNFTSPSTVFSEYVIEELTGELVNGNKLTVVDRHNLELITQEMKLQLSGEVSDASAQAVGKKLGAQSIVSGSLTNMGTYQRFRIKAINVETAAIQTQVSYDVQNDDQVVFLLSGTAPAQAGARPSSGQTNQQSTAASAPIVYKIGDIGPAGGWVFYDKGRISDGWRYLEAAPKNMEFKSFWATADARSVSLMVNGLSGWRLPNQDELNRMYASLKLSDLGDFNDDWYWSSKEYYMDRKYAQSFRDGKQEVKWGNDFSCRVRAVRQF